MTIIRTWSTCSLLVVMLVGGAVISPGYAQQPAGNTSKREPIFDVSQLPAIKGTVRQYLLTPQIEVSGVILEDGTQVRLPPHISTQVVATIKPGDKVTINGLKARALPLIDARAITNDATGVRVLASGYHASRGEQASDASMQTLSGLVRTPLYNLRGRTSGAVLENGTLVRVAPTASNKVAELLKPGATVAIRGHLLESPLGSIILARQLGSNEASLVDVSSQRSKERSMMGGHGMMDGANKMGGPMEGPMMEEHKGKK